jgi:hypothetical protein
MDQDPHDTELSPPDQPPCLTAALEYAERGWYVFFSPPGTRFGVMGQDPIKYPGNSGKRWSCSKDPEHLRWQFNKGISQRVDGLKDLNVCIATGKDSGLVVVDVDSILGHGKDGFGTVKEFAEQGLHLPETLMAETWSGGRHYYYRYDDRKIGVIANKDDFAHGIDIKAEGGMVVAPPSSVPKKNGQYCWLNEGTEIAELPLWLFGRLTPKQDRSAAAARDQGDYPEHSVAEIARAMALIGNPDLSHDDWVKIAMALYSWNPTAAGFELFDKWSQKSAKYKADETHDLWYRRLKGSPPDKLSIGTIIHKASAVDPYWLADFGAEVDAGFAAPPPPPGSMPPPGGSKPIPPGSGPGGYRIRNFVSHLVSHRYIYRPTGDLCPGTAVNGALPPIPSPGKKKGTPPTAWLDKNQIVAQMTWAPGEPEFINDRIIREKGGWLEQLGIQVYNLYSPPNLLRRAGPVNPWLDHMAFLYGEEARRHLLCWFAHRVQRPGDKINHALVLGGKSGIGKDCMVQPLKMAVGPWNFAEASPQEILGRFNPFLQSVVLRISEAHDIGDANKFNFHDRTKKMLASPPDVLMIDNKHIPIYAIPNVAAAIITTNHRTDGLYLPADDRRHYVLWSERTREEFNEVYWNRLWPWYENGGYAAIAAFLADYDLSGFDPKAPPLQTEAFLEIVAAHTPGEDAEMRDALDKLNRPEVVYVDQIAANATPEFSDWLLDRKNNRQIPHRLASCDYTRLRNPESTQGLFSFHDGRRRAIYRRRDVVIRDALALAFLITHPAQGSS